MKALLLVITLITLLLNIAWAQSPFTGTWQGGITLPNGELAITVRLDLDNDPPTGTIDIPAQGVNAVALENISSEGTIVRFTMSGVPGSPAFEGTLTEGGIHGTFTQGDSSFPFALESAPAEEARYVDPEGFYSVPLPANWTAEERDGYSVLISPDSGISVYTLSIEGTDIDSAIAQAWQRIDPTFALEASDTHEPPATGGIEAMKLVVYEAESDRVVQVVARLYEDRVYLMIFTGATATFEERLSQVTILDTGFTIVGLETVDLSGREARELTPELLAELEAFIKEAMREAGIPGLAISIVRDGEIVYAQGFGVREMGSDAPVTPETLMMIGSTGKTMTTMLMATLVDAGLMTWDTPVVDIMPEFRMADPDITQQVTVQHLVCACTGVPRRDFEIIFNSSELTAEDIVESLATFRLFTGFGEAFQYSNQMVATGGYVAAVADGGDYGGLMDGYLSSMQTRVFDPIGMTSTTLRFEDVLANPNYALPHATFLDGTYRPIDLSVERFVLPVAPAGAPWSNVLDMGRYLITELSFGVTTDGTRVVSEENLRKTWEPQVPLSADTAYGLGWFVTSYKGLDLIAHGGNNVGYTSGLSFLPSEGIGVSILANASQTNDVNYAIRTRLFELLYDLEPEAATGLAYDLEAHQQGYAGLRDSLAELDTAALTPFLGRYTNAALGAIELRLETDALVLDAGEFVTELCPLDAEGVSYTTVTPPLPAGLKFTFEMRDGQPAVVFDITTDAYVFTRD